jgi:L-asparaginase type II
MSGKPTIHVIGTGGTISGAGSSATAAAYESGRVEASELVAEVEGLSKFSNIQTENLFATGSENLGPNQWRILARRIEELTKSKDVDGVVVTHGTDTLEEASFFLHLVCNPSKPVVLTAAMRPATALSADGQANLFQSILAAASSQLKGHGIQVVMNGTVIPGWQAIKTDSAALESFRTYPGGIIGRFSGERMILSGESCPFPLSGRFQDHLQHEAKLPLVGVIFLQGGYEKGILEDFIKNDCRGVVIAGFGAGTLPDSVVNRFTEMENPECVIVVSSRVPKVMVMSETMTQIKGFNAVPSGFLNPQKSALLLSLALEDGLQTDEIASLFKKLYS